MWFRICDAVKLDKELRYCMFPSGPRLWQTGCFVNYDLCLGAFSFTPFAIGCSVKKFNVDCLYVKYFMDFNIID